MQDHDRRSHASAPLPATAGRRPRRRWARPDAPRPAPPVPERDTLAAIRWDLDGLLAHVPDLAPITPPASLERAALHWRRQALERAMEHGAAMLDALGLPRLVDADFVQVDGEAVGAALALAVETLDALDGDAEAEPWLGWAGADRGGAVMGDTLDREAEDEHDERPLGWTDNDSQLALDHGSEDGDSTAPERAGKGFAHCGPDDAEEDDRDENYRAPWPGLRADRFGGAHV